MKIRGLRFPGNGAGVGVLAGGHGDHYVGSLTTIRRFAMADPMSSSPRVKPTTAAPTSCTRNCEVGGLASMVQSASATTA